MNNRLEPQKQISRDDPVLFSLMGSAHECSLRFLCPIYLVGSFLTNPEKAKDIDLIFVMSEDRIKRLFGSLHFNDKRLAWRRKQKIYFEDNLRTWDFDIKIQTPKHFDYYSKDSLRLDSVPDDLLLPTLKELFSNDENKGD